MLSGVADSNVQNAQAASTGRIETVVKKKRVNYNSAEIES